MYKVVSQRTEKTIGEFESFEDAMVTMDLHFPSRIEQDGVKLRYHKPNSSQPQFYYNRTGSRIPN